jgi:hypothetical protein
MKVDPDDGNDTEACAAIESQSREFVRFGVAFAFQVICAGSPTTPP